jgi:hypothetical protein
MYIRAGVENMLLSNEKMYTKTLHVLLSSTVGFDYLTSETKSTVARLLNTEQQ